MSDNVKKHPNRDEYTEAYMKYYPLIMSTLYAKLGNKDEAEDICQEVFITLYNKFAEVIDVRKWLFGTMRFELLRFFERKYKTQQCIIDDNIDEISLGFVNGFRDTRILITEALNALECTEDERLILDLIATHKFSYGHVAELQGLTRRQVEYKYGQLVKKIIDFLREKGIQSLEELL